MTGVAVNRWGSRVIAPRLTRPDLWLLFAVAALVGLGIVMVFNVGYFHAEELYGDPYAFFRKHLLAGCLGVAIVFGTSRLRPELLQKWAGAILLVSFALLAVVLVPGVGANRGGATRWINLGGFNFQPSEAAKLAMVVYLARWLSRHRDRVHQFHRGIVPPLVVFGACSGLLLLQPDFGTTAILGLVTLMMLFVAGARPLHLAALSALGVTLLWVGVTHAEYRMRRFTAFLNPWEHAQDIAFQLVQSLIAFGSGGFTGVGLGQSRQKLFYLPEAHTDFIFALVGEELGLIGAAMVLALFAVICVRGFRIASRHPDHFSALLAFGLTLVIVIGAAVNIGVVLGLLPTKGLALPFLSYGGSALMGAALEVGILAALSRMTG